MNVYYDFQSKYWWYSVEGVTSFINVYVPCIKS